MPFTSESQTISFCRGFNRLTLSFSSRLNKNCFLWNHNRLSAKPTETPLTLFSSPSTKVPERTVMAILLNHLDLPVYRWSITTS
jgi:hypothetical protein